MAQVKDVESTITINVTPPPQYATASLSNIIYDGDVVVGVDVPITFDLTNSGPVSGDLWSALSVDTTLGGIIAGTQTTDYSVGIGATVPKTITIINIQANFTGYILAGHFD